jgi:hypothetical protein
MYIKVAVRPLLDQGGGKERKIKKSRDIEFNTILAADGLLT